MEELISTALGSLGVGSIIAGTLYLLLNEERKESAKCNEEILQQNREMLALMKDMITRSDV